MHKNVAGLSIAMMLTLAGSARATETNLNGHVRPANPQGAAVMAEGLEQSQTIRELAATLDQSDLVAYVATMPREDTAPPSGIRFVGRSKVQRYVLIQIGPGTSPEQRIALLAHELQHAVEASRSTWVNDEESLGMLFARIGWRDTTQQRGYNTTAASLIERQVRRELMTGAQQSQR